MHAEPYNYLCDSRVNDPGLCPECASECDYVRSQPNMITLNWNDANNVVRVNVIT